MKATDDSDDYEDSSVSKLSDGMVWMITSDGDGDDDDDEDEDDERRQIISMNGSPAPP